MTEFLLAAYPWVGMGLVVAVFITYLDERMKKIKRSQIINMLKRSFRRQEGDADKILGQIEGGFVTVKLPRI